MSKEYKEVPISTAREIAETFDKNQVIIICWDSQHQRTHVTTYGKTLEESQQAAEGGNFFKRAMGWPEEECNATSGREKE